MAQLFGSLQWSSQPVSFHPTNHGRNIQLEEQSTVARKMGGSTEWGYGLVCTSEPVEVGKMLKVTVMDKHSSIDFGGVGLGFTTDELWLDQYLDIIRIKFSGPEVSVYLDYKKAKFGGRSFDAGVDTYKLKVGDSVGILLTREKELHWFVNALWVGSCYLDGFPLDKKVWGLVDVCASCKCVKAETLSVALYDQSDCNRLLQMGLISEGAAVTPINSLSSSANGDRPAHFQESIMQVIREEIASQTQELRSQLSQQQEIVQQLTCENELLKQEVANLRKPSTSNEAEFWQVSPDEVSIREDQILGRGAWGYVAKGTFQGTPVAVKRMHTTILNQTTFNRVEREIHTMAQIRHPNLVLFIAAVLHEQTGPMIVTELLDTSLREVYQAIRISGANKLKIFRDIASALAYLHALRQPIIHRDVSTANVLLLSLSGDTWLAKLSDFGSANLARYAVTCGEGSLVYTAPEAFPQHPNAPQPHLRQTTKIDVYSFGVLACEVITRRFPETDRLNSMLDTVRSGGHRSMNLSAAA